MPEPSSPARSIDFTGIVIIGRNEAALLRECIGSLPSGLAAKVYVDSASTDQSVAMAREVGIEIVQLDPALPLSAARARSAGFDHLLQKNPHITCVQFIDADCLLCEPWLAAGFSSLRDETTLGAVWGWRRERHPHVSIYNRTCDLEWLVPPAGEVTFFGGDVLLRVEAYRAAGGYDPAMIASEDHEFSARLRRAGWTIRRLDVPMTLHDSRMRRAGQWWRRAVRRGVGYGQMFQRHHQRRERIAILRIVFWTTILPIVAIGFARFTHGISLAALLLYPLRIGRIALASHRAGRSRGDSLIWGIHCVAAAFPYGCGLLRYVIMQALGKNPTLIEYRLGSQSPESQTSKKTP